MGMSPGGRFDASGTALCGPRVHRLEQAKIFAQAWQYACSACVDMYVRPGADEVILDDWMKMWDQAMREGAYQALTSWRRPGSLAGITGRTTTPIARSCASRS